MKCTCQVYRQRQEDLLPVLNTLSSYVWMFQLV